MYDLMLNHETINIVKKEAACMASDLMKSDLVEAILYGSCARGDFAEDSDIDIALITKCSRMEVKKYDEELAHIATDLAMKYFAIVNFVCLPVDEYIEKKAWYAYFRNIDKEGEILYG
ncbi:MAG: nucleotidyltransferase domain-containing protein [Lachnospiraceae bacterium]|nr:nucleotidyltransferase domain-containing protein [Lachnospiraceae bacterium]